MNISINVDNSKEGKTVLEMLNKKIKSRYYVVSKGWTITDCTIFVDYVVDSLKDWQKG